MTDENNHEEIETSDLSKKEVRRWKDMIEAEKVAHETFRGRLRSLMLTLAFPLLAMVLVTMSAVVVMLAIGPRSVTVNYAEFNETIGQLSSAKKTLDILVDLSKNGQSVSPEIQRLIELANADVQTSLNSLKALHDNSSWASLDDISFISAAHAQTLQADAREAVELGLIPRGLVRTYLMAFIIGVITLAFFGCLVMYFVTNDPDKVKFASNTIQTVLGFYIGVATGLIGIPAT